MPLKFKALDIPAVYDGWNLSVRKVDVVAANPRKQLPLHVFILPLLELPVLAINKDCDDSSPSGLCEIGHTVIYVELNDLVPNTTANSDHLA